MVGNLVVNVAILRHAELGDLWPVSAVTDTGSLVGIWPNGCRRPRPDDAGEPLGGRDATRTADDVRHARQSPGQNIVETARPPVERTVGIDGAPEMRMAACTAASRPGGPAALDAAVAYVRAARTRHRRSAVTARTGTATRPGEEHAEPARDRHGGQGLLVRQRDPGNRRYSRLLLTEGGRALQAQVRRTLPGCQPSSVPSATN